MLEKRVEFRFRIEELIALMRLIAIQNRVPLRRIQGEGINQGVDMLLNKI